MTQREKWNLAGFLGHICDSRALKVSINHLETSVSINASVSQQWDVYSVYSHQKTSFPWKQGKNCCCALSSPLHFLLAKKLCPRKIHRKDSSDSPFYFTEYKTEEFVIWTCFSREFNLLKVTCKKSLKNEKLKSLLFVWDLYRPWIQVCGFIPCFCCFWDICS